MKKLFCIILVCTLFAASAAFADPQQSPQERVKEGADRLIKILSESDIADQTRHAEKIKELRDVADQYIDFRLVTMYAIGRPWKDMSDQLRTDLTEAFVQLLERTYLTRIPTYEGQGVQYKSEQIKGKKARVVTEIIDKEKKIVVEFRLRIIHKQWMIYDVVAEGVSLVSNYRSQFSQILNEGTGEDLLKRIQDQVKKLDNAAQDEGASNS